MYNVVTVCFPGSNKEYQYNTKLTNLHISHHYTITTSAGDTYRNTPVQVKRIKEVAIPDPRLKLITEAVHVYPNGIPIQPAIPMVKRIIAKPADGVTVVFWSDNTKTVVRTDSEDTYSLETGVAMAYMRWMCGQTKTSMRDVFEMAENSIQAIVIGRPITNGEFYKDEIAAIGRCHLAIDKNTGKLCRCDDTMCEECLWGEPENCFQQEDKWLDEEYKG